jgi:outer membrane protein assembly factor BamB
MTSESPHIPTPHPSPSSHFLDRLSVALMTLLLLAIPLVLVLIWLSTNPNNSRPLDQFVPTTPGTTLVYQVTLPDGTTHYQTSNVGRYEGNNGLVTLNLAAGAEIMRRLTGSTELSDAEVERVLETRSQDITIARLIETSYTPTTTLRIADSFFLLHPNQVELISIDDQNFLPFVPFYDGTLDIGASRTSTGTYGIASPYSATLTFEAEEAVETPIQRFEQCQRFLLTVEITDVLYSHLRSWFCEGVGLVLQEATYDHANSPTRLVLVAAHTAALHHNGEVPPLQASPSSPITANAELGTEWEEIWSFNDGDRQRRDISTQIVSTGDLYLWGDEEGQLLAIDRITHQIAWRFHTGNALYATPVVVDGMVYVAGSDKTLYALEVRNGAFRWAFTAQDLLSAPPTISDGKVYLGAEDSTLYVLEAQTGVEQWRYTMGGPIAATPVVFNGVVYVGADDGGLYALDAATGDIRWIFPSDAGINGSVAIADGIVYVGNVDGWVYALNAETTLPQGEVLWAFESDGEIVNDLVARNGLLYFTNASTLYALNLQTGLEAWRFPSEFEIKGAPLLLSRYAFINLGRSIAMLDPITGEEISRIPSGSPESDTPLGTDGENLLIGHIDGRMGVLNSHPIHPWRGEAEWVATRLNNTLIEDSDALSTPPVLYEDALLYVSTYGQIFRVNRTNGDSTRLGTTEIQLAYVPPIVVSDTLIAGNFFGQLTAFNLQTNSIQWQIDLNNATFTSVYGEGNHLLWAATVNDELIAYAFDLTTGTTVWQQPLPYALAATPSSILHHGTFYVGGDHLTALNPATGEILWQSTEPFLPLFLTALENEVYAMAITEDFETFVVGWDINSHTATTVIPYETDTLPALYGGMASGNGIVLLASETGNLTALDVASQSVWWQVSNGRGLQGMPLITTDTILYTSADNHLHARSLSDGALVGDFASPATPMSPSDVDGSMAPLLFEGMIYSAAYQEAFALKLR